MLKPKDFQGTDFAKVCREHTVGEKKRSGRDAAGCARSRGHKISRRGRWSLARTLKRLKKAREREKWREQFAEVRKAGYGCRRMEVDRVKIKKKASKEENGGSGY